MDLAHENHETISFAVNCVWAYVFMYVKTKFVSLKVILAHWQWVETAFGLSATTLYRHKHIRPNTRTQHEMVLVVFMGQNDFVPQNSYVRSFSCTSVNLHKQKHNIETEILTKRVPKRKRLTDVHK